MHNANTIFLLRGEIKNPFWIMLSNGQRINTPALPMRIMHVQYFIFDTLTKVWLSVLIKMNWRLYGMCFFIGSFIQSDVIGSETMMAVLCIRSPTK